MEGVRGEAWFVYDAEHKQYLALTFGTLKPVSSWRFTLTLYSLDH